ncbi:alkyl hydroperoxide reductase subunit C [Litorivivens sp.]|uniref:alkyl hydroperoxide reductase subunit C n=1 Tax=Litorivivens sp. TaxID=2020868 RepID=UPI003562D520
MAKINQTIPDFKAEAFHNGEFKTITADDVKGKWAIFLFYPADFTFVCPTELEDMAKHYDELQSLGVEVFSVSTDTHFVHKAWHDTSDAIGKIRYPMLGDPTGKIARGFDVMIEEEGVALRGTFLADPDGVIKVAEIHDLGIGRSAKDMLRKVKAAQYVRDNDGEVCPAAWEAGQDTLKPSLDLVGKI